jgi:hypothetical protein
MKPRDVKQPESPSVALDAKFAASSPEIQSAIRNYKDFWATLSNAERAKLEKVHKLLKHLRNRGAPLNSETEAELLIGKAVNDAHIDKELFGRWWAVLVPVLTNRARFDSVRALMWAKIAPGTLRGDLLGVAKLAAQGLKASADRIYEQARRGNKRFFIDLGKCLSGEIKRDLVDAIDDEILRILSISPSISAKEAVRKLSAKGWQITEENFRVRKQRLKAAITDARGEYDRSEEP